MGLKNKDKALDKLRQLQVEIDGLVEKGAGGFMIVPDEEGNIVTDEEGNIDLHNVEFDDSQVLKQDGWKRETETAISYIFNGKPNKSEYLERLRNLNFGIFNHPEGVEKATALFTDMISEIEEYW